MNMKGRKLKVLFSSLSSDWRTPNALYNVLNEEFHFDHDPCPLGGQGGLFYEWGKCNFVNPPYGRGIDRWIKKALLEKKKGKITVMLLPARTDTKWFHDLILPYAEEIRFIRGRLKFGWSRYNAPFPSMVVVFQPS